MAAKECFAHRGSYRFVFFLPWGERVCADGFPSCDARAAFCAEWREKSDHFRLQPAGTIAKPDSNALADSDTCIAAARNAERDSECDAG